VLGEALANFDAHYTITMNVALATKGLHLLEFTSLQKDEQLKSSLSCNKI
jgi:hypothetical protein